MKKTLYAAGALLTLFVFSGADCLNEEFVIPAEVDPYEFRFKINNGNGSFQELNVITPSDYISDDIVDDIEGGNVLDITVQVKPAHPGRQFTGQIRMNGQLLTSYGQDPWDDFLTERSMRREYLQYFQPQPDAIKRLGEVVFSNPLPPTVTFENSGTIFVPPGPADTVIVRVYTQGKTRIKI